MVKNYFYLVKVQYLGFRYHGWQKQPGLKTIHLMIDKTLSYIFHENIIFKTLGAGRTDAMVSAQEGAFELFLEEPIEDLDNFMKLFNYYLPQDIKALSIVEVGEDFNVIQSAKIKEYIYLFTHGHKTHPFCASLMTSFRDQLDIDLMIEGGKLFTGTHNFRSYCSNIKENGIYKREIISSEIVENNEFSANFFPEESYLFRIKGKGFGHNQIRLMMGMLVKLGKHEVTLDDIQQSLKDESEIVLDSIAPASGLILHSIAFE